MHADEMTDRGREDVSALVEAAIGWKGLSGPKISATGRVSRATIDRVKRCEVVGDAMLRALGDVLGLPRDFLLYVGKHDVERVIGAAAGDPDLLRWTLELMGTEAELGTRGLSPRARKVLRELGYA